jgi:uncharacterized membrane protein HdeD (DUF308 family)
MFEHSTTGRRDPNELELPGLLAALFKRSWWAMAVRGLLAIALGVTALSMPGVTLLVLLAVMGGYMLLDGVFTLITAFRAGRNEEKFWPYVIEGALSVMVGVLAFMRPEAFILGILLLIAVRSIVTGSAEIAAGARLRKETGERDWMLWIAGAASIIFGVALMLSPGLGIPMLVWFVSVYAIIFGVSLVGSAFRMKTFVLHHHHAAV